MNPAQCWNERTACCFLSCKFHLFTPEPGAPVVKSKRGRGRRGRFSHGSHDNGPLLWSSTDSSLVAGGNSGGSMSVIIGGDGDDKGPKKKVHCMNILHV